MKIFYTDGSCLKNGSAYNEGGFGVVELDSRGNYIRSYAKRNKNTTNNIEELRAILYVMLTEGIHITDEEWLHYPTVYSDSAYCVNTLNDWMFRWANNGWLKADGKVPENLELIKAYYDHYQKGYRIDLRKVKGHSGDKWNELADKLATGAISPEEANEIYG